MGADMNNQPAYDGKRRTQTLADVQETIRMMECRRDKRLAGQNRISPGADRWQKRADTYPGIAAAVAQSVSNFIGRN